MKDVNDIVNELGGSKGVSPDVPGTAQKDLIDKLLNESSFNKDSMRFAIRAAAVSFVLFAIFLGVSSLLLWSWESSDMFLYDHKVIHVDKLVETISEVFVFLVCFGTGLWLIYSPGGDVRRSLVGQFITLWNSSKRGKKERKVSSKSDIKED